MPHASNPKTPVDQTNTKRALRTVHVVAAYGLSIFVLLAAIVASHVILANVIKTQKTLTKANTLISDIQLAMSDSIGVLNDHQEEASKTTPNQRLLHLIARRAEGSVDELTDLRTNLENMSDELMKTPIWEESKWIVDGSGGSINDILSTYVSQMTVTITPSTSTVPRLMHLPVEAAAARGGAMSVGYHKASDQFAEEIAKNSNKIENLHKALTASVIAAMLLLSLLVVTPLWLRVNKEHKRLGEAHQKLYKIAFTDRETGLPNLDGLESRLQQQVSFSDSYDHFYLLLVRLRNLDELYNLIGSHQVEDLLQLIARRLQNWNSQHVQWSRSGEAEFSSVISQRTHADANEWIQALHFNLTSKLTIEGVIVTPTVSMAVSKIYKSEAFHANILWEHQSNARLASVNFQPPACWLPEYEPGLKNKLTARNDLINQIEEGIAAGQFVPFYQLKVNALTGAPCSVEVLARWITPDGTLIPPDSFIPAAESSGLIVDLTYSLFDQVLFDVNQWCASGLTVGRIAINVACDVLFHDELLDRLAHMNSTVSTLCEGFEAEITENIALGDQADMIENILNQIRRMGIKVAIDDFGTGYASLQTLIEMPVDVLKIDRSFVLPMTEAGTGNEVVSTMISLSNRLNKTCVVEGVETEWQWRQLTKLGADELQGYYFHKPSNAYDTQQWLHKNLDLKMAG